MQTLYWNLDTNVVSRQQFSQDQVQVQSKRGDEQVQVILTRVGQTDPVLLDAALNLGIVIRQPSNLKTGCLAGPTLLTRGATAADGYTGTTSTDTTLTRTTMHVADDDPAAELPSYPASAALYYVPAGGGDDVESAPFAWTILPNYYRPGTPPADVVENYPTPAALNITASQAAAADTPSARNTAITAALTAVAALAPIQPAAASEALLWQFLQNQPTISYDGSVNPPVTSINPTMFQTWAQLVTDDYNPAGSIITLALLHCALDQATVDGLLSALATVGVTGGTFTLSGATPSGYAAHQDYIYTLDFRSVNIAAIKTGGVAKWFSCNAACYLDPTIASTASTTGSGGSSGVSRLGISDLTTATDLATAAVTYGFATFNPVGASYGSPVDNGDGTMTVTDSNEGDYGSQVFHDTPGSGFSATRGGTGVLYTLVQAGVVAATPASITTIINNGNTLSINP